MEFSRASLDIQSERSLTLSQIDHEFVEKSSKIVPLGAPLSTRFVFTNFQLHPRAISNLAGKWAMWLCFAQRFSSQLLRPLLEPRWQRLRG